MGTYNLKVFEIQIVGECKSKYFTPVLSVKKANDKDYHLVQGLGAINQVVQDINPVVANPYTLLTALTEEQGWFTVLDQKDAFFCISIDDRSQEFFCILLGKSRNWEKNTIHLDCFASRL